MRTYRVRIPALAVVAILVTAASPAAAQFPVAVAPGARVRVTVPDVARQFPLGPRAQVVMGTVERLGADTLYITVPNTGGTLAVPRARVRALAVSRGAPSRGRSALAEGARYAVLSAFIFATMHQGDDRDRPFRSTGQAALVGGALGLGLGTVLGAVSPRERWHRLRLPR